MSAARVRFACLLVLTLVACRGGATTPGPTPAATSRGQPTVSETAPPASPPNATPSPPPAQGTAAPPPTPTAAPTLRQLTTGGCCTQPFWSPAGDRVLFIDQPSPDQPVGIYAVGLDGGPPTLLTERIARYDRDMQWRAFPEAGLTTVERMSDGSRWTIANGGRPVTFSPFGDYLTWTGGQTGPPFDRGLRQVWVSGRDGSNPHVAMEVHGGGFAGWLPDDRLLVRGRMDPEAERPALWIVPAAAGAPSELLRAPRIRSIQVSPQGNWLAYLITFSTDATGNGLWVADVASGETRRLDLFGAYRWRGEGQLLVIPMDVSAASHQLWQVDTATGEALPWTDPESTPFRVANGDWAVSPDGRHVVFVSAEDHNLWSLTLPGGTEP